MDTTPTPKPKASRISDAVLEQMLADIEDLKRQVSSLVITRPRELTPDEAAAAMTNEPGKRFVVVASFPDLGLRAGDTFDPRSKLANAQAFAAKVRAGLRVSIAA
jgi:hypothetical protein